MCFERSEWCLVHVLWLSSSCTPEESRTQVTAGQSGKEMSKLKEQTEITGLIPTVTVTQNDSETTSLKSNRKTTEDFLYTGDAKRENTKWVSPSSADFHQRKTLIHPFDIKKIMFNATRVMNWSCTVCSCYLVSPVRLKLHLSKLRCAIYSR